MVHTGSNTHETDTIDDSFEWNSDTYLESVQVNSALLSEVKEMIDLVNEPAPNSTFAEDAITIAPLSTEAIVRVQIQSAIDHISSFAKLVASSKQIDGFAQYTLLRSGIEISSTAIWLMSPEDLRERVKRLMKIRNVSFDYFTGFNKGYHGGAEDDDLRETIATARRNGAIVANSAFPDLSISDLVSSKYKTLNDVLSEANIIDGLEHLEQFSVSEQWKLCSSIAHGYDWANKILLSGYDEYASEDEGISVLAGHTIFRTCLFLIFVSCHMFLARCGYPGAISYPGF